MSTGITVDVSAADWNRLEAIVADRNCPQKHAWRARIALLTSEATGMNEIMRRRWNASTKARPARPTSSAARSVVTPATQPKAGQLVLDAQALHSNPFDGHTVGPVVAGI